MSRGFELGRPKSAENPLHGSETAIFSPGPRIAEGARELPGVSL